MQKINYKSNFNINIIGNVNKYDIIDYLLNKKNNKKIYQ